MPIRTASSAPRWPSPMSGVISRTARCASRSWCPGNLSISWSERTAGGGRHRLLAALALAGLLLAGCGFKLQGSDRWPAQWRSFALAFESRDPELRRLAMLARERLIQRRLQENGDGFVLDLRRLRDRKLIAAIGGDGKAVEFELQRDLRFQLRAGTQRSPVFTVSASRRFSFDPAVLLAKEAEEERLQTELSREIIELMLLRTEAQLRAWSAAVAPAPDEAKAAPP